MHAASSTISGKQGKHLEIYFIEDQRPGPQAERSENGGEWVFSRQTAEINRIWQLVERGIQEEIKGETKVLCLGDCQDDNAINIRNTEETAGLGGVMI